MFSTQQKREIADGVQKFLRATNHPELPAGEINFALHVDGAESWSWADIRNNGVVTQSGVNPWNEAQDPAEKHGVTYGRATANERHRIEIKVTVNETGEVKTFDDIEAARGWAESVRQTLGMWGGEPTFSAVQVTTEDVGCCVRDARCNHTRKRRFAARPNVKGQP